MNDPFVRLSHIISDIPAVLEQAEGIRAQTGSPLYDGSISPASTAQLADRIERIEGDLAQWEQSMVQSDAGAAPSAGFAASGTPSSPLEPAGPTFEPSTILCIYHAARLLLARADRRDGRPSHGQLRQWAVSICHTAAQQIPNVRDIVTAVVYLFTLRVAYFTLPERSNGRKWIEGLFAALSARFGLPLAHSILIHLPGPEGPALREINP